MTVDEARKALELEGYPEGFEQTLIVVKPDGVRLGIHPAVAALYGAKQFIVVREVRVRFDISLAWAFFGRHEGNAYFQELLQYMTSGDSKAYVLTGWDAAQRAHRLLGATDPREAEPTSIRGLFRGHFDPDKPSENFVHASDHLVDAAREVEVLFGAYPVLYRGGA